MIIYYWLAAIGICFILKYGSILEWFRSITTKWFPILGKLYKCCLCMGVWVGVAMSPILVYNENWSWFETSMFPFTVSCLAWYADTYITLLNAKIEYYSNSSSDGSKPIK